MEHPFGAKRGGRVGDKVPKGTPLSSRCDGGARRSPTRNLTNPYVVSACQKVTGPRSDVIPIPEPAALVEVPLDEPPEFTGEPLI